MNTDTYSTSVPLSTPTKRKFGRLYVPDARDRHHTLAGRMRRMSRGELKRRTQAPRKGPILDQENTNRCVMFSAAACLGAYPTYAKSAGAAITRVSVPLDGDPDLYRWACNHDEFDDNNSGEDLGTSVRAAQEYLRKAGISTGYDWARTNEEAKDFISRNGSVPLQAGTDWWSSFDRPNAKGVIEDASGFVEGGHAWCVLWFSKSTGLWKCQNSWGAEWGAGGLFYLPDDVFDYIVFQANGELTAFDEVR